MQNSACICFCMSQTDSNQTPSEIPLDPLRDEAMKVAYIRDVVARSGMPIMKVAELCGLPASTLHRNCREDNPTTPQLKTLQRVRYVMEIPFPEDLAAILKRDMKLKGYNLGKIAEVISGLGGKEVINLTPRSVLERKAPPPADPAVRTFSTDLPEGRVTLTLPPTLPHDSLDQVEGWLRFIFGRMRNE